VKRPLHTSTTTGERHSEEEDSGRQPDQPKENSPLAEMRPLERDLLALRGFARFGCAAASGAAHKAQRAGLDRWRCEERQGSLVGGTRQTAHLGMRRCRRREETRRSAAPLRKTSTTREQDEVHNR
jgi:hypothetical protein